MIARMSIALELLERNRRLALADDLTGLGNRRRLVRDLESPADVRDATRRSSLALFDLDGFKRYNDTFGHAERRRPAGAARRSARDRGRAGHRPTGWAATSSARSSRTTAAGARRWPAPSRRCRSSGDVFSITSSSGRRRPAGGGRPTPRRRCGIADSGCTCAKRAGRSPRPQTRDAMLKMLSERDPALRQHMRGGREAGRPASPAGSSSISGRDQVERAAELHDIGKIALPDAILAQARGTRRRASGGTCASTR